MEQLIFHCQPLAVLLLSWFWVNFEPVQNPIDHTINDEVLAGYWLKKLLSCWKCVALWLSIVWFGFDGWVMALAVSFTAWLIDLFVEKWLK